jgi:hypothetical protein
MAVALQHSPPPPPPPTHTVVVPFFFFTFLLIYTHVNSMGKKKYPIKQVVMRNIQQRNFVLKKNVGKNQ